MKRLAVSVLCCLLLTGNVVSAAEIDEPVIVFDEDRSYFEEVSSDFIELYNLAGGKWFESTYKWGKWEDEATRLMNEARNHFDLFCEKYHETSDYYMYGYEEYKDSEKQMNHEADECILLIERSIDFWNHHNPDLEEVQEEESEEDEHEEPEVGETEEEHYYEDSSENVPEIEEIVVINEVPVCTVKYQIMTVNTSIETYCTHGALTVYDK